jgi:hypothetical protein
MSTVASAQSAVDEVDEPFAASHTPLRPLSLLTALPWSVFQAFLPIMPRLLQSALYATLRCTHFVMAILLRRVPRPHACRWSIDDVT